MQEKPLNPSGETKKPHRFIPRFASLLTGIASGIFMGNFLLKKSLHQWVNDRINFGKDAVVDKVRQGVLADMEKPDGPLNALKGKRDSLLKQALEKKSEKEIIENTKINKLKNEKAILEKTIKEIPKKDPLRKFDLQDAQNKINDLTITIEAAGKKAEENFNYFYKRAESKLINGEIIKRMQIGLRQSEHRALIFTGGIVTLGAAGFITHQIMDYLLNGKSGGKEKNHQQAVIDSRALKDKIESAAGPVM